MTLRPLAVAALVLALGAPAHGAALTCADLMRLHRAGMRPELLVELIESSQGLEPLTSGQESLLAAAGLPQEVLAAYRARSLGPDDERLVEINDLLEAGIDADLVAAVIGQTRPPPDPTPRDLDYMRRVAMPQRVIAAVLAARVEPEPVTHASPAPAEELAVALPVVFDPVRCMYRTTIGLISREIVGKVELDREFLRFTGATEHKRDVEIRTQVLNAVWLDCSPGPTCYELGVTSAHGHTLRLRDEDWRSGGNARIMALYEALQTHFAWLEFHMNVAQQ